MKLRVALGCLVVVASALAAAQSAVASGWALQSVPSPVAQNGVLSASSCASATVCTAVGTYIDSAGNSVTFVEAWNGTSWKVQGTPNPTGATGSYLDGVSCSSAAACTAVGSYDDSSGMTVALVEAWNGTRWRIQQPRDPVGATRSVLDGVSCTSATACTAVGSYDDSSGTTLTLVEAWNGTSWTIQSTPNPTRTTSNVLESVSCISATICTGVGQYVNFAGETLRLVEAWNGTSWTIQSTPNPARTTLSYLDGVSCSSAAACTAVGVYVNSTNTALTLVEAVGRDELDDPEHPEPRQHVVQWPGGGVVQLGDCVHRHRPLLQLRLVCRVRGSVERG